MARQSPELRASLQKLRRAMIHDLPAMLKNELIGNVEQSAEDLMNLMKAVAPVDADVANGKPPGTLRDSHNMIMMNGGLRAVVRAGGEEAPYAIHVEQGTVHAPAHSWFWPSYRLSKTSIKRRLSRGVTKAIKFWNSNGRAAQ